MAWNEAAVTDAGLSVLARGILEQRVEITSAVGGESCSDADLLSGISEIAPPLHSINIAKAETEGGKALINLRVQNKGIKESFVIRQIGVYAKIYGSMDSPILLAVIQDRKGEVIPAEKENPEFLLEFDLVIPIENSGNIQAVLTPDTFATLEDLREGDGALSERINNVSEELTAEKNQSSSHRGNKNNPHSVTKAQVGLSNVPNVTTDNQTPTYTASNTLAELASGEKLSTAFGKLAKAVTDLIAHLADSVKHITSAERTNWNGKTKTTFSRSLNSGTKIGTINVDGTATDIFCEKNTDTTYSNMTGASASAAGVSGLVPAPAKGNQGKYLRGDGTWQTPPDTNTTYSAATTTAAGLMSAADKTKLDGIAAGANNYTYTLPVAASTVRGGVKIGYTANGKNYPVQLSNEQMYVNVPWTDNNTTYSNMTAATASAAGKSGLVPAPAAGAQGKYLRGDGTWQTPPDTNTTYSAATQSAAGLMSADDKKKLDGVAASANNYSLPAATSTARGGVKIGYTANGKNYPVQLSDEKMYVNVPWTDNNTTYSNMTAATASAAGKSGLVPAPAAGAQGKYLRGDGTWQTPPDTNTTYSAATQSVSGLMSADDKKKLDGVAASANNYTHPSTSGNKHIPSGGSSGQILRWSADGTAAWGNDNNTTYSNMTAATASAAGKSGLVPAPAAGAQGKYLRGDGTWQTPPDTNTTYSAATTTAAGLMSAADKTKLDGIATGANNYTYTLPVATSTARGGVKIGYTANGKNYPVQLSDEKMYVNVPWTDNNTTYSNMTAATDSAAGKSGLVPAPAAGAQGKYLRGDGTWQTPPDTNTTYSNATTAAAGLMSASDKTKLDGMANPKVSVGLLDGAAVGTSAVTASVAYPSGYSQAVIECWFYKKGSSAIGTSGTYMGYYDCISMTKTSSAQSNTLKILNEDITCSMTAAGAVSLSSASKNAFKYKVTWYK